MSDHPTPSDMLMEVMSHPRLDEMSACVIIWRKEDGSIGYRCTHDTADTMGLLRFALLSVEHDLIKSWDE